MHGIIFYPLIFKAQKSSPERVHASEFFNLPRNSKSLRQALEKQLDFHFKRESIRCTSWLYQSLITVFLLLLSFVEAKLMGENFPRYECGRGKHSFIKEGFQKVTFSFVFLCNENFIFIHCDVYEIDFKLHFNPSICLRFPILYLLSLSSPLSGGL